MADNDSFAILVFLVELTIFLKNKYLQIYCNIGEFQLITKMCHGNSIMEIIFENK